MTWDSAALDRFWNFIVERQRIWTRRSLLHEKPPWTTDPLLANTHVTNVYRELDPGTVYALTAILNAQAPPDEKLFNLMAYRLIGLERTHQTIGWLNPWEISAFGYYNDLRAIRESGQTVYTGAYMVCGYGKGDKDWNVAKLLTDIARDWADFWASVRAATSRKGVFKAINARYGFGPFLAYQVMVDASYPLPDPLAGWEWVSDGDPEVCGSSLLGWSNEGWTMCGPGAQRGARVLLPDATLRGDLDEVVSLLSVAHVEALDARDMPWLASASGEPIYLTKANLQNCLCEFYKVERFRAGNLAKRRTFDSKGGYRRDREARGHGQQIEEGL